MKCLTKYVCITIFLTRVLKKVHFLVHFQLMRIKKCGRSGDNIMMVAINCYI